MKKLNTTPARLFLIARAISTFGSQITIVALPLVGVINLHADPLQMGLISFSGIIPIILASFFSAVFIDNMSKRNIIISTNIISAGLLLAIPLSQRVDALSISLMIIVNTLSIATSSVRSITLSSLLPQLVPRESLLEVNRSFLFLFSFTRITGPAVAGFLITMCSAPQALVLDALSFVISAIIILGLPNRQENENRRSKIDFRNLCRDINAGFKFIFCEKTLSLVVSIFTLKGFFGSTFSTLIALYIVRDLGVKPVWFGFTLAMEGAGTLLAAFTVKKICYRLDPETIIIITVIITVIMDLFISFLSGPPIHVAFMYGFIVLIGGFTSAISSISLTTYIQKFTPPIMLTRVTSALAILPSISAAVGAVVGGILANVIGVRYTLITATVGTALILIYILLGRFKH